MNDGDSAHQAPGLTLRLNYIILARHGYATATNHGATHNSPGRVPVLPSAPVRFLIVRHAPTVAPAEPQFQHARPLTADGRLQFTGLVRRLQEDQITISRLLHSPWTRAVQTADLLMPVLNGTRTETDQLARAPTEDLVATLCEGQPSDTAAAVGHHPWVGDLAQRLLGPDCAVEFDRGTALLLDGDGQPGTFRIKKIYQPGAARD